MFTKGVKVKLGLLFMLFPFCFSILVADVTDKLERVVYPQELDFKDVKLSDALSLISKTSGITIIAESSIKDTAIDLFFVRGQSLKEILQALMLANNFEMREANNILILEKSNTTETEIFGQIIGRVLRGETESGIEGSIVSLVKNNRIIKSVKTEAGGTYIIENIDPGTYIIKVSAEEYGENGDILEIEAGKTQNINLTLSSDQTQKLELTKESVEPAEEVSKITQETDLGKVVGTKGEIEETKKVFLRHAVPSELTEIVKATVENIDVTSVDKQSVIILKGSKGNIDTAIKLINQLDEPVSQVRITAQVLEITDTLSQQLGINWSYESGADSGSSSGEVGISSGIPTATFTDYLSSGDTLSVTLDLLKKADDASVASIPSVVTVNGETATIEITEETYIGDSTTEDEDGNTTTEATYKEAGTSLSVTPTVRKGLGEKDTITLEISLEVSSFITSSSTSSDDEDSEADAAEQTNSTETTVRVLDGGIIFIGGYKKKSVSESDYSVPYISKIPLLGKLFKYESYVENVKDLFIQIKAEIVTEINSNNEINTEGFRTNTVYLKEKLFND